jgi:hypothetical protein
MLLSTFGSKSVICCLTVSKFRNICSSFFITVSFETRPSPSDVISSYSSVPVVPTGIRFWMQSSSQAIERFFISTKIEHLFLVHRTLKGVDATLPCSLYSLHLDTISRTVYSLRPSALLMLALLWPLSNRLIMSSFVSRVITLRFFLSDSTDISLFLLGMMNFYKILIIT